MAELQATLYEIKNGAAWITLNRPQNRNALSAVLVSELYGHLLAANADSAARSIVITGAAPAFCAGADLKSQPGASVEGRHAVPYPQILATIVQSPKPVIAAVNGAAFAGGLGLVGASDIVIASETAQFSFSEVRIGVIPAVISVVCVPKLGIHHAMRLFVTGVRFTAAEAVAMGLVHRAVAPAELEDAVNEELDMINRGGPNAVVECKKLVRRISQYADMADMEEAFRDTAQWSSRMFHSDEAAEGMAAFREKRDADWVG